MKVIIPKKPYEEIMKDIVNPISIQWLVDNFINDKYDPHGRFYLNRACQIALLHKEELKDIYDKFTKVKGDV